MTKNPTQTLHPASKTKWGPPAALLVTLGSFFGSQLLIGIALGIYGSLRGWSGEVLNQQLRGSVITQFWYILGVELAALGLLWLFLHRRKAQPRDLGLKRPVFKDLGYAVAGYGVYFVLYLVALALIHVLIPGLDVNQKQELGFSTYTSGPLLVLVFCSLVILPAVTEEIIMRGFLYTGLRSKLPKITAALLTSALFAAAHLPGGGSGGLLWVGAVDTFVLSLVLCYIRENSGSIVGAIGVHFIKNSLAFVSLFIFHVV